MENFTSAIPGTHTVTQIDRLPVVEIGPGCTRRDLPSNVGVRVWIVDMAAGSEWPHVDHHDDAGEEFTSSAAR